MKIKSCFPQKQLDHSKPYFVCKLLGTLSDNKVLFHRGWFERGIKILEHIYDFRTKQFHTLMQLQNVYNISLHQIPNINGFINLLQQTREFEEYIAFSMNKLDVHRKKWQLIRIT